MVSLNVEYAVENIDFNILLLTVQIFRAAVEVCDRWRIEMDPTLLYWLTDWWIIQTRGRPKI